MRSQSRVQTLSEVVVTPEVARSVVLALVFAFLTAACARITIPLPFTPVPITGQTFAVLLAGAVLGSRLGASSMLTYLGIGATGMPVFATTGGPPSYGYLVGFVLAAYVVGFFAERGWDRKFWTTAVAMLAGNAILYVPGLIWLGWMLKLSVGATLTAGLIPFIPGDLIKLVLAAIVLPSAWALVQRTPRS